MSENLEKTEKTLRDLIETLRDGHQGFIELEKNLKDPEAREGIPGRNAGACRFRRGTGE